MRRKNESKKWKWKWKKYTIIVLYGKYCEIRIKIKNEKGKWSLCGVLLINSNTNADVTYITPQIPIKKYYIILYGG